MIGLTLALYVTLYLALIVAYVAVLKYMAEKPEELLAGEAVERAATPPGGITAVSPIATPATEGGRA
jgi:cytochrome d ubiquinol oxidase subunit I